TDDLLSNEEAAPGPTESRPMAAAAPQQESVPGSPHWVPPAPRRGARSPPDREAGTKGETTMPTTMAQALAERVRYQTSSGEKVLQAAGDQSGAVFGNPQDVLSVRGNVSDVALTNHLWLLDAVAAGAVQGALPSALQQPRPTSVDAAVQFL